MPKIVFLQFFLIRGSLYLLIRKPTPFYSIFFFEPPNFALTASEGPPLFFWVLGNRTDLQPIPKAEEGGHNLVN